MNHVISKAIVAEALKNGCTIIALEDLTHIRDHICAGRKVRSRLHRWPFRQLQDFIDYKAKPVGILVVYINPAYTSQSCYKCGSKGTRSRHSFFCRSCGRQAHADVNASLNIARLGVAATQKGLLRFQRVQ